VDAATTSKNTRRYQDREKLGIYIQIRFTYFFLRPTKCSLPFRIDQLDAPILAHEADHHGDILKYFLKNLLLLSHFIFGPLTLGNFLSQRLVDRFKL
jgi:hypothetical protein